MLVAALVLLVLAVGCCVQRVAGLGFGLLAAPVMALLLGPVQGVVLVNATAVLTAGLVLTRVRPDVDWRRFSLLGGAALVGIVPGAVLALSVPSAWLELVVGVLVLVALATTLLAGRAPAVSGRAPAVGAGLLAGVMNATAGVGGPAFSVYGVASRWPQRSLAATLQPLFMLTGAASAATKLVLDPGALPDVGWPALVAVVVAVLVGVAAGDLLARRTSPARARAALVVVASLGALAVAARGASDLLG